MGSNIRPVSFYVPVSILMKILSRLPVKSLLRFKCVDKLWRNIISSQEFKSIHLNNDASTDFVYFSDAKTDSISMLSLLKDTNSCIMDVALPLVSGEVEFFGRDNVYGSCNGIVCLKGMVCYKGMCLYVSAPQYNLALWNPATRDFKRLPSSNIPTLCQCNRADYCTITDVGFGFDAKTDDYKILHIKAHGTWAQEFELYSLRSNSWRELEFVNRKPRSYHWRGITSFSFQNQNSLCWLALTTKVSGIYGSYIWEIVAFNLSNEKFDIIELPLDVGTIRSKDLPGVLFQLKDSIAVIVHLDVLSWKSGPHNLPSEFLDVWVSDQNYSWNKMFSIRATNIGLCPISLRAWGYCGNGQVIFHDASNKNLISYDLLTQEIKHLGRCSSSIQPFKFKESLIAISKCY